MARAVAVFELVHVGLAPIPSFESGPGGEVPREQHHRAEGTERFVLILNILLYSSII